MTTTCMGGVTAAFILLQAASGCGSGATVNGNVTRAADVGTAPIVPAGSVPLATTEVPGATSWNSGHLQASRLVIRDVAAWEAWWGKVVAGRSPTPPAPAIDFARHIVLAVAMGQRNSGGYGIVVDSVYANAGTVYAVVRSVTPGSTCMVATVMTAPVTAVTIDRTDASVRFVEKAETRNC